MASQFHNRLVGTIVIVALGVIFLPDLLDGKKAREEEAFSEIPLRPAAEFNPGDDAAFEVVQVPSDDTSTQVDNDIDESRSSDDDEKNKGWSIQTDEREQQATAKVATKVDSPPPQAKVQTQKTPEPVKASKPSQNASAAFTLQLGSFNNATNVKALVSQLRKGGFTAYTLPEKPIDGRLTKVFVGPDVSEAKLKKLQQQVEKLTGLKGRVVSYNPLETE